jgi:hypothetical protein
METKLLLFALPLQAYIQKSAESMQTELINSKCNSNNNQKFPETDSQDFYSCLPKEIFRAQILWIKNNCDSRQHVRT